MDHGARTTQQGPIQFESEVDRVYLNTSQGSQATVVWNPWVEKSNTMGDMAPKSFRGMVCVETANAAECLITVPPGAAHRMTATYSIETLA